MKSASVAELKAKLSEYLAAARRGEEVIVTDRGRPVARLSGLGGSQDWDARITDLVRDGLASPPQGKLPHDFWDLPRGEDPDGALLQALLDEREDGW